MLLFHVLAVLKAEIWRQMEGGEKIALKVKKNADGWS